MKEIIAKYLSGEASPEEKQKILSWLKEDKAHKKIFSEMRDIWIASVSSAISESEARDAFSRFKQNIHSLERKKTKYSRKSILYIAASIAVLIVCTLGGYFAGKQRFTGSTTKNMLVMNQVIMGNESKGTLTLPDGTFVWLNANSKISYPETFSGNIRKVKLEGEAYFSVTHDAKSPFIVESGQMEVNVLGTQSNMKNYTDQLYSATTLLSGKVEVRFSPENEFIVLIPNQTALFDKQNNTLDIRQVNAKDYIIWTNDKVVFSNELLSDILYKMEKWYNIEINCADNVPLDLRLSFTIRKENKEEIFKTLELIAPIKSTIEGYKVFIRKR